MGYKQRAQLPDAWLHILKGRVHQLPTEAPPDCARHVRTFILARGKDRPRIVDGIVPH